MYIRHKILKIDLLDDVSLSMPMSCIQYDTHLHASLKYNNYDKNFD
jgi:hypothetical protein